MAQPQSVIAITGLRDEQAATNPALLTTYIDYKRTREVDAMRLRPHPYEFALYYDI